MYLTKTYTLRTMRQMKISRKKDMFMSPIVRRAAALAEATRVRIVQELLAGQATVSDLGARIMLAQPRVSTHLKILLDAGLVAVETAGRQRVYRFDAPWMTQTPKSRSPAEGQLQTLSPPSTQATREVRRNSAIRQARTCYDHLAGVAGVHLLEELLKRQWLTERAEGRRLQYSLTPEGVRAFTRRGIDLEGATAERRALAYGCPDWTERRPHLAGALGAAVFRALKEVGVVRRSPHSRVVTLRQPLQDWFDDPMMTELPPARQVRKKASGVA